MVWWPVWLIVITLIGAIVPAFLAYRRRERENASRTLARDAAAAGAE